MKEAMNSIDRELALIKVAVTEKSRAEVLSIIDIFRCKVVDVGRTHYTVEVTGDENKIQAIIDCSGRWASTRLCARARLRCSGKRGSNDTGQPQIPT